MSFFIAHPLVAAGAAAPAVISAYNPTNLPEEFGEDGLPVKARIRLRTDMMGIHQAGPLVEVLEIRKR